MQLKEAKLARLLPEDLSSASDGVNLENLGVGKTAHFVTFQISEIPTGDGAMCPEDEVTLPMRLASLVDAATVTEPREVCVRAKAAYFFGNKAWSIVD